MSGDSRFHARRYISQGWSVIPIPKGEKGPRVPNWQKTHFKESDFGPDDNIGVRLGDVSGDLVDVDLDCMEAVKLAPKFLSPTGIVGARKSKPQSHYFYTVKGVKPYTFKGTDGSTLLEIRANGQQTVLPPSIHPSGEDYYWEDDSNRAPGPSDEQVIFAEARMLATAVLLAKKWPGNGTTTPQHDVAGYAAGYLAARGLKPDVIALVISSAAELSGDDNVRDRERFARETALRFGDGDKPIMGGPSLAEILGEDLVRRLGDWYGGNNAVVDDVVEEMNVNRFGTRVGKDYVYGLEEEHSVVFQPARALFEEFSHQKIQIGTKTRGDAKGDAIYKTKFEIWREHPKKRTYRKVTFAPQPAVAHELDYNLWKGFAVHPLFPADANKMDEASLAAWAVEFCLPKCQSFFDLTRDVICSGNEEHYAYMVNLLALTVQYPGVPSEVAVVLKGDQGAGKGTFVRTFGRGLFGRHFVHLDRTEQLAGKFNASLSGKVVVFADEAFFAGDKRDLGALKRLITEPTLAIERKGIDIIEEPNFMHLFMATNEKWAHQAGIKERRFFTVNVSTIHVQDFSYFNAINDQMHGEGLQALLSYLLTRKVDHEAVRRVPKTDELRAQQEQSLPLDLRWWRRKLRIGELGDGDGSSWPEYTYEKAVYDDFLRYCDVIKYNRQRPDEDEIMKTIKPWLGTHEQRKQRADPMGKRRWMRKLLPLADARVLFDEIVGTKGEWVNDEEDGTKGPDDGPKDLPF